MSLLRKAGIGLAVTSMAAMGTVAAAGSASAADGEPVFVATSGDLFGALALSQSTRNVVYAVNYTSWDSADAAAVSQCGGGDCQVVVHFANACGAVAVGGPDSRFGWAWAKSKVEAESAAMDVLNKGTQFPSTGSAGGRQAKVIMSVCTDNAK